MIVTVIMMMRGRSGICELVSYIIELLISPDFVMTSNVGTKSLIFCKIKETAGDVHVMFRAGMILTATTRKSNVYCSRQTSEWFSWDFYCKHIAQNSPNSVLTTVTRHSWWLSCWSSPWVAISVRLSVHINSDLNSVPPNQQDAFYLVRSAAGRRDKLCGRDLDRHNPHDKTPLRQPPLVT